MKGGRRDYEGVQVLRALAALLVVFGHSVNLLEHEHLPFSHRYLQVNGGFGVDIFFAISGFVMTVSAGGVLRQTRPAQIFLWRRLLRVAPLYWSLTAFRLCVMAAWPSLRGFPPAWNAVASFLFVPSVNSLGEIRPVIPVGWTLNFEMLFYLLFGLSLLLQRERFVRVLVPLTCAVGLLGVIRTAGWPAWTAWADPIVLEFVAGVGIALLAERGWLPRGGMAVLCAVTGLLGAAVFSPNYGSDALRPLREGVPAALMVLGVVGLEDWLHSRVPRGLLFLGGASYAIYLVQTFCFPALGAMFERISPGARGAELPAIVVFASMVMVTMAGSVVHLLVERPMTRLLKERFGTERIAPIAR